MKLSREPIERSSCPLLPIKHQGVMQMWGKELWASWLEDWKTGLCLALQCISVTAGLVHPTETLSFLNLSWLLFTLLDCPLNAAAKGLVEFQLFLKDLKLSIVIIFVFILCWVHSSSDSEVEWKGCRPVRWGVRYCRLNLPYEMSSRS